MKALVLSAIKEFLLVTFGFDKWKNIAESVGIGVDEFKEHDKHFTEGRFQMLLEKMSKMLNLTEIEIIDQFVFFWMTGFAPRVYSIYLKKSSTPKEFLMGILEIQNYICKIFPNQYMTKVDFQAIDQKTLSVVYPSEKVLVDLVAVLRGVNSRFEEKFVIRKINPHSVEIKFEKVESV